MLKILIAALVGTVLAVGGSTALVASQTSVPSPADAPVVVYDGQ